MKIIEEMKLADKPCYPSSNNFITGTVEKIKDYQSKLEFSGLTFRERLIVALASGAGTIIRSEGYEQEIANGIIRQADAIIKELEKENDKT